MRADISNSATCRLRLSRCSARIPLSGTASLSRRALHGRRVIRVNIVCNGPVARVRAITDQYRQEWAAAGNDEGSLPKLGMSRFLVLAPTDAEAEVLAEAAYRHWYASFIKLWRENGTRPPGSLYSEDFREMRRLGFGIVGTPARAHEILAEQITTAGINYLVCRFAFGNLAPAHAHRSLELFANELMPRLSALPVNRPLNARASVGATP